MSGVHITNSPSLAVLPPIDDRNASSGHGGHLTWGGMSCLILAQIQQIIYVSGVEFSDNSIFVLVLMPHDAFSRRRRRVLTMVRLITVFVVIVPELGCNWYQ